MEAQRPVARRLRRGVDARLLALAALLLATCATLCEAQASASPSASPSASASASRSASSSASASASHSNAPSITASPTSTPRPNLRYGPMTKGTVVEITIFSLMALASFILIFVSLRMPLGAPQPAERRE
jgi:hypothetical protein